MCLMMLKEHLPESSRYLPIFFGMMKEEQIKKKGMGLAEEGDDKVTKGKGAAGEGMAVVR